ncbi:Sel1 domain-containing protein [Malaciobacter marinus]|uniref:beta-lactamase n=1 Tax=Malaciobacter marinus TaxID=505249 RepID=A0A347TJD6_9BACT|nr:tetratricopeptide repeat protein [Malaciobacter marinus]AXX86714.1 Sel1 domain-containing protein [Malaciobacter marinus]PHO12927.1 hypothetical protein CPG38_05385 [Malaciobacter marinus]PHO14156.1 hypothetical protein CPH92_13360 [Malaciobacter marinus]
MIIKYFFVFIAFITFSSAMTFEQVKSIEKENGVLEALGYYKDLAQKDNTKAIFRLAMIYAKGEEIQRNISNTFVLLTKGATLGDKKAGYYLGKLYLNKKLAYYDEKKAYNLFLELSNANYVPAYNMMGKILVSGIAVDKDYKLAVKYFEKASKAGFTEAHCNLALMYASGQGVFPNFGRAHTFAKEGMKKNHPLCIKVYEDYNLRRYPEDKGFKFNFYTEPE